MAEKFINENQVQVMHHLTALALAKEAAATHKDWAKC